MGSVILKMQAFLRVAVGTHVYYDCPLIGGESFEADAFFKKYRGKTGTIAGFSEERVGILDPKGRLPGIYVDPNYIDVIFDGETVAHRSLNIVHFIALGGVQAIVPGSIQKMKPLPFRIRFYPGDVVRVRSDPTNTPRTIEEIYFDSRGRIVYRLAETDEVRQTRLEERAAVRAKQVKAAKKSGNPASLLGALSFSRLDFPNRETHRYSKLALISRGKIFALYEAPQKLVFGPSERERDFWSKDGVSRIVYSEGHGIPRWEHPLARAKLMLEQGKGDFIAPSSRRNGLFAVRKLHSCFAMHHERVLALNRNSDESIEELCE